MSRRIASHYLFLRPDTLTTAEQARIAQAIPRLRLLTAEEQMAVWHNPLLSPRQIPSLLPYSTAADRPERYLAFAQCCLELADDNTLLSLSPFQGETESTEWYPGMLVFAPKPLQ